MKRVDIILIRTKGKRQGNVVRRQMTFTFSFVCDIRDIRHIRHVQDAVRG